MIVKNLKVPEKVLLLVVILTGVSIMENWDINYSTWRGMNPSKIENNKESILPKIASIKLVFTNNTALDEYCAGNGTDGTPSNPHIIKDIIISDEEEYGILLENINRSLILENITIKNIIPPENPPWPRIGALTINNSANIFIRNCSISNNQGGMSIIESENITVTTTFFHNIWKDSHGKGACISGVDAKNISITWCDFRDSSARSLDFLYGSDCLIANNTMIVSHKELYYIINMESIHDSQIIANNISRIIRTNFHGVPGMTIDKCEDLNISQNFISSVDIGIALRSSNNCEIHLNQLRHISDIGFYVWYSDNNIFQANSFANVSRNIYVNGMGNIFIDNCNLISPTWITTDTPIFQRNYTVNWNIVPNVDFYEVWVNETQVGTTLELYFQIIFPEDGLYYISLVAVNESGRSGFSDILEMHVNNGIYLSIEIEGNNDNAIYVGNLVHFACIFNGGNDHLSFSWDFGDLSPLDTGSNVSHIYKSSGNYLVTHTVTDANGINSSVAVIIEILPKELFGGIPGYPVEIIVLLTICSICLPFLKIFREKR